MTPATLRIATRSSDLAVWQAAHVAGLIRAVAADVEVTFVPVTTHADVHLEVPIAEIGGKGVFAKEVQRAVLDGRADLAVHSAKDLTAVTGEGLHLVAVPERGDPRDALAGRALSDLAPGAVVGTGSTRRRIQILALRGDLDVVGLRGNIATRLERIGDLDAIVVAAAALHRLGLDDRAAQIFDVQTFVPQVAQGALAVECRAADEATIALVRRIEHEASRIAVDAERAFLERLGGDCDVPAGAHATVGDDGSLAMVGMLAAGPGESPAHRRITGEPTTPGARSVGRSLAAALMETTGVGR